MATPPVHIAQIFLSEQNEDVPESLKNRTQSIKTLFRNAIYTLYDNDSLRNFIKDNYSKEVLDTYDCLIPFSYKADLGRFCIVNKLGGWYFDISMYTYLSNIDISLQNTDMIVFTDIAKFTRTSWAVYTTPFYSIPNNPVLEKAIEMIVKNCREGYYGTTPLCPTGPNLFGRAIAIAADSARTIIGAHCQLTPEYSLKNHAVVLPDGTIFAFGKNAEGGDLTSFGAKSTNNYSKLWMEKKIYKQTETALVN